MSLRAIILSAILIMSLVLIFLGTFKRKNILAWPAFGVLFLLVIYGLLTGSLSDFLNGVFDGIFGA